MNGIARHISLSRTRQGLGRAWLKDAGANIFPLNMRGVGVFH